MRFYLRFSANDWDLGIENDPKLPRDKIMDNRISDISPQFLNDYDAYVQKIEARLQNGNSAGICRRHPNKAQYPNPNNTSVVVTICRENMEPFPDRETAIKEIKAQFNTSELRDYHVEEFLFDIARDNM